MNRFPAIQTDLLFTDNPPVAAPAEPTTEAPANVAETAAVAQDATTATTTQPAPLAPQMTGVLEEPISGGQTLLLVLFGLSAAVFLFAITRYGRENNYGD